MENERLYSAINMERIIKNYFVLKRAMKEFYDASLYALFPEGEEFKKMPVAMKNIEAAVKSYEESLPEVLNEEEKAKIKIIRGSISLIKEGMQPLLSKICNSEMVK